MGRPGLRASASRQCSHHEPGCRVVRLTSRFTVRLLTLLLITIGLLAAPIGAARAQRVLTVVAHDTALEVPLTVPAGMITVRLQLDGSIRRELVVHRIPAGTLPEDLVRGASGRPERWFDRGSFGGPAVPRDSANDASATFDLRPGRYALVAYEVDAAGRPKPDKYIWREVTVVAAAVLIPARFSVPDMTIRLKDSRIDVTGALRPGSRTLQIENAGNRPHDLIVGRLKPGKTIDDVRRWDRGRGDAAPFVYVAGLTPMSTGVTAQTKIVLQSGTHVVLCSERHSGERTRDNQRGVLASFTVK